MRIPCSKCGFREMTMQHTVSSGSSVNEFNDGGLVRGLSCPICAKWIEPSDCIVMKYDPRKDAKASKEQREVTSIKAGLNKLSVYDRTVWKYRDSIEDMMERGTKIENIIKLVSKSSQNIPARTKCIKGSIERLMSGRLRKLMECLDEEMP